MKIKALEIRSGAELLIDNPDGKILLNITYYTPRFEITDSDNGTTILEYKGLEVPFDNTVTIIANNKSIKVKGL